MCYMNEIPTWPALEKPVEAAYNRIALSILNGAFQANSILPNEYSLAELLGVTRSTLREALQRLSANGMIEIRHGKPTRVRDIWVEGNMNTLACLVHLPYPEITSQWAGQMLEVRLALTPAYTGLAVRTNAEAVCRLLEEQVSGLKDQPEVFAKADWDVHHGLTILSKNVIFTLILNGFKDYYQILAQRYFEQKKWRQHSQQFYLDLYKAAEAKDELKAAELSKKVMADSILHWQEVESQQEE